jgi:hypothetical protein
LTNPNNTPLKLKVTDTQYAVKHDSLYGPYFGNGWDLHVSDSSNTNTHSHMNFKSYDFPNGKSGEEGGRFCLGDSHRFQTAEIEVFKVISK